jgi:hypothetical protein
MILRKGFCNVCKKGGVLCTLTLSTSCVVGLLALGTACLCGAGLVAKMNRALRVLVNVGGDSSVVVQNRDTGNVLIFADDGTVTPCECTQCSAHTLASKCMVCGCVGGGWVAPARSHRLCARRVHMLNAIRSILSVGVVVVLVTVTACALLHTSGVGNHQTMGGGRLCTVCLVDLDAAVCASRPSLTLDRRVHPRTRVRSTDCQPAMPILAHPHIRPCTACSVCIVTSGMKQIAFFGDVILARWSCTAFVRLSLANSWPTLADHHQ